MTGKWLFGDGDKYQLTDGESYHGFVIRGSDDPDQRGPAIYVERCELEGMLEAIEGWLDHDNARGGEMLENLRDLTSCALIYKSTKGDQKEIAKANLLEVATQAYESGALDAAQDAMRARGNK